RMRSAARLACAHQYSLSTLSGFAITATVRMLGIVVEIISNHLGINSSNSVDVPVTFAPGLARLATSPDSTGSPFTDMTTGMVVVAFFAARVDGMQVPTIAAGLRLTKDAASCGNS